MRKLSTELQGHQQRVLSRLADPNGPHGLIAYHSVGAGKTLTALKALEEAKKATGDRGLFVAPASLVSNAWKELDKHKIPLTKKDLDILSYEKAVRMADELKKNKYGLAVFDEAHKLRNAETTRVQSLRPLISEANKALFLSGTAGYNHPGDVGALINLLDSNSKLPNTPKDFENQYVDDITWQLKNKSALSKEISKYVDVYSRPQDSKDYPTVYKRVVQVPMSEQQERVYHYLEDKLPIHLRKAVRNNLPLSLQDSTNLNMFATGVRQASVSPMHHNPNLRPEDSPKLLMAANLMAEAAKAPRFRGVAYSNFLDAGLNPYAELLKKQGIKPLMFTGGMSAKSKKALVDDFNSPTDAAKVLLVSSSGGEGLDLKGVRKLQVLEPHFNSAKIDQVQGRGTRYLSHAHLPENERDMTVEEFHSTLSPKWYNKLFHIKPNVAIDDYLADVATKKQKLIDEMRGLVQ